MTVVLVTGGTGQLGVPTVGRLRSTGHDVRVLSRERGEGIATGDLVTGAGVNHALEGVQTVVHLASTNSAKDIDVTRDLTEASSLAGVEHFVFMSIVGIDDIPLAYYKVKAESERIVVASGVPHSILRATQFHSFVEMVFRLQRYLPVLFTPAFSFQPIAVDEVASRLVELVTGGPAERAGDIGGPEQLTARRLGEQWKDATASRRALIPLRLPGRTFAGFAAGHNLVPGVPYGHGTFAHYLASTQGDTE
ncbi:NmrA family NAD(P)-binding protein [Glaciihabitans sp. UYNi722]|uniref:SDR family oxidoreductase n=1 Tax=Glaciihabitans sp. UYNi722 TaxID=3156344 RepID=UPI003399CF51